MSEQSSKPLPLRRGRSQTAQSSVPSGRSSLMRRLSIYAGIALLGVLGLAYIDGGEEPIRPISQPVSLPSGAQGGQ